MTIKYIAYYFIIFWITLSLLFSVIKNGLDSCDTTYYVDYIIFTKLFCPVEGLNE